MTTSYKKELNQNEKLGLGQIFSLWKQFFKTNFFFLRGGAVCIYISEISIKYSIFDTR